MEIISELVHWFISTDSMTIRCRESSCCANPARLDGAAAIQGSRNRAGCRYEAATVHRASPANHLAMQPLPGWTEPQQYKAAGTVRDAGGTEPSTHRYTSTIRMTIQCRESSCCANPARLDRAAAIQGSRNRAGCRYEAATVHRASPANHLVVQPLPGWTQIKPEQNEAAGGTQPQRTPIHRAGCRRDGTQHTPCGLPWSGAGCIFSNSILI